jgi:hypothetical protein
MVFNTTFNNLLSYIVAVSCISGGHRGPGANHRVKTMSYLSECGQLCLSCKNLPEGDYCPTNVKCQDNEVLL